MDSTPFQLDAACFDAFPDPVMIADRKQTIVAANKAFNELFRFSSDPAASCRDVIHKTHSLPDCCASCGHLEDGRHVREEVYAPQVKGGRWFEIRCEALKRNTERYLLHVYRDITDRRRDRRRQDLAVSVLDILNDPGTVRDMARQILGEIQRIEQFECISIRLKSGTAFVIDESQSSLPPEIQTPAPVIETSTRAVYNEQCLCARVFNGRLDPSTPGLTENGSFWSADMSADTSRQISDPLFCPTLDSPCPIQDTGALALIPLRAGQDTFGILHISDHETARLNADTVRFYEGLGHSIGIALTRQRDRERTETEAQQYARLKSQMPIAYARHEIICDENQRPVDYRFLDINDAFTRQTRLGPEIIGKRVLELLPGTESHWIENYGRVALTGEGMLFTSYAGELDKWYEVTVFRPQNGQFICLFFDVSDRVLREKKLADALRESRRHQEETLALLEGAGAVLENTAFSDAVRHIYKACKNFTGATAGYVALTDKNRQENRILFLDDGGTEYAICTKRCMPVRGMSAEAYRLGKTVYENNFPDTGQNETFPKDHIDLANIIFAPMKSAGGIIGLIALANKDGDFTEQDAWIATAFADIAAIAFKNERAIADVKENESLFRSMAESTGDLLCICDKNGNPLWDNAAWDKTIGRSVEEMKDIFQYIHHDDAPRIAEHWKHFIGEKAAFRNETFRLNCVSGIYHWFVMSAVPIEYKREACYFLSTRDITTEVLAEDEREARNQRAALVRDLEKNLINYPVGNLTRKLEFIVEKIAALFLSNRVSVMLPNPATGRLNIAASIGLWETTIQRTNRSSVKHPPSVSDFVFRTGKQICLTSEEDLKVFVAENPDFNFFKFKGKRKPGFSASPILIAPIKDKSEIFGVLNIDNGRDFAPRELDVIEDIVELLAREIKDESIYNLERAKRREREILLKEIHHRVKNNLQLISSMLNLQILRVKDADLIRILSNCTSRIDTMALIHTQLYQGEDLDDISMKNFLRELVEAIHQLYPYPGKGIRFDVNAGRVFFPLDRAIPCGLIVNELVSNAIKYAFPKQAEALISVHLKKKRRNYTLSVSDNGLGLPEGFGADEPFSLGMDLVRTLTEQLNGKLQIESEPGHGAVFTIHFGDSYGQDTSC